MIVDCPACHTRYRLDVTGPVDETTFFECTRRDCGHVFPADTPIVRVADSEQKQPPRADDSIADTEVTNSFPPEQLSFSDPQPTGNPQLPLDNTNQQGNLDFSTQPPVENERPGDARPLNATNSNVSAPTGPEAILPSAPSSRSQSNEYFHPSQGHDFRKEISFATSVGIIIFLVGIYAIAGIFALSFVETTASLFSKIPVLNRIVESTRPSNQQIVLTKLRGGFWQTKDQHTVFAIAGTAINETSWTAGNIQIEGTIYDKRGEVVGQQTIYCGTETAPEVLQSLTIREVRILRSLMPPRQFSVASGEAVNFLITFANPPKQITEFGGRVVEVKFGYS